jgi:PAT family beta-lactamase induction signal transducer AmpG
MPASVITFCQRLTSSRRRSAALSGVVAGNVGWPMFFLATAAAAIPAFLLMLQLTPWGEKEARGAFDPSRDAT